MNLVLQLSDGDSFEDEFELVFELLLGCVQLYEVGFRLVGDRVIHLELYLR